MWLVAGLLFFLSGASALIYQVIWLRLLSLVFGVTVYAASTVLASFMAGLAIGSAAAGRIADRVASPLRWFGVTEILIGATGLLSPVALEWVRSAYVWLAPGAAPGPTTLTLARLVCSALVLLPPTILMGATLPLILRSSVVAIDGIGTRISLLYGINTAGAIAGALAAGFVLIGAIGMSASLRVAASLNVIVGVTAIVMSRRVSAVPGVPAVPAAAPPAVTASPDSGRILLPVFALSGFSSLALEVVWFRTLVLYYPATTYAFTAMLATVLAGIAAGSFLAALLMRRRPPTWVIFGGVHAAVGVAAVTGFVLLSRFYDPAGSGAGLLRGAAITILPAAVLMGIAFPAGCGLWVRSTEESGRRLGAIYGVNLGGAIAGSLASGFVLLPWLGITRSLISIAGLSTATGIGVLLTAKRARPAALAVAGAAVLAFALIARDLPDPFVDGLTRRYRESGQIFMRDEGVQTTVSVHMRELGGRLLYLDGLHQASDGRDVVLLHRQIGHLPLLLHPAPRRALAIGLGGGATSGAMSLHPGLALDIVELAPGVVRAAQWFTHINEDVLRKPHVRLRLDDGRNHMLLTDTRYDVVTADIIQPTHAGAGLLYSQEYFRLARETLEDGGLMVQWVGPRSDTYYRLIARTFQSVFPETTVWVNGTLLVGSTRPLRIDREAIARKYDIPALRAALAGAGFPDVDAVLAAYTAGPGELRAFLGEGPVLTDDKPMLEYYLSLPSGDRPVDLGGLR
jgi:spermidine synthase